MHVLILKEEAREPGENRCRHTNITHKGLDLNLRLCWHPVWGYFTDRHPPIVLSCSGCGKAVRADLQTRRLSFLRPLGWERPRRNLLRQRHVKWRVRGGEVSGECVLEACRCAIFCSEWLERCPSLSDPRLIRWRGWLAQTHTYTKIRRTTFITISFILYVFSFIWINYLKHLCNYRNRFQPAFTCTCFSWPQKMELTLKQFIIIVIDKVCVWEALRFRLFRLFGQSALIDKNLFNC